MRSDIRCFLKSLQVTKTGNSVTTWKPWINEPCGCFQEVQGGRRCNTVGALGERWLQYSFQEELLWWNLSLSRDGRQLLLSGTLPFVFIKWRTTPAPLQVRAPWNPLLQWQCQWIRSSPHIGFRANENDRLIYHVPDSLDLAGSNFLFQNFPFSRGQGGHERETIPWRRRSLQNIQQPSLQKRERHVSKGGFIKWCVSADGQCFEGSPITTASDSIWKRSE